MGGRSNIYLVGYRCTGKSVVGRALAEDLGRPFIDADDELVRTHGMTVQHIVRAQGWAGFREKEKRVLDRISQLRRHVIATGGGAVLSPDNIARMRQSGTVVWLRATPDTIRQRLLADTHTGQLRPSLTSKGVDDEIEEVLKNREPLYQMAAHYSVETDGVDVASICRQVLEMIPEEAE
ncbi:Shikimate kinase I (EC [Olavius algarvensis associated proteobacterium Delta 3]|nr:Shikimate kinase I (EC [Olavius algarvensis associated proteobacterium Delta 3]CAB5155574.1 Shikimate kinase I (EC [Olavius algarvensis associated proteobacterium Delta 3]